MPQEHLYSRRIAHPRGKVLGGSSAINYMVYIRGNRADYDHWRALGNKGWGYQEVLPHFIRMKSNQRIQDRYHGSGGPIVVSDLKHRNPLSAVFIEAAEEAGVPHNSDFNGATQDGCGYYQLTCQDGVRCSAADGYLKPVVVRTNLEVVTNAVVTRLLIENGRAVGVECLSPSEGLRKAHASTEVLLCGGVAINSPQLLMLSGIGPADELRQLGIDVVVDLPGVGKNLQDHLACYVKCTTKVAHSFAPLPMEQKMAAMQEWEVSRSGPLTSNFLEADGFVRVDADEDIPNFQLFFVTNIGGLTDFVRKTATTTWHPVGTCKMGTDALSVVDAGLKIRGIECARAMNASVMPTLVSGNTNAPTMMIAEKASDLIRYQA